MPRQTDQQSYWPGGQHQHRHRQTGALDHKAQPECVYQTLAFLELFPAAMAALETGETVDNSNDGLPTVSPASTTTADRPSSLAKEAGLAIR